MYLRQLHIMLTNTSHNESFQGILLLIIEVQKSLSWVKWIVVLCFTCVQVYVSIWKHATMPNPIWCRILDFVPGVNIERATLYSNHRWQVFKRLSIVHYRKIWHFNFVYKQKWFSWRKWPSCNLNASYISLIRRRRSSSFQNFLVPKHK